MVIFGYKSRIDGPMRALIALAVGIMMVVFPASALALVVKIIAAFIFASAVVSLIVGFRDKARGTFPLMSFNAVINLLIGFLMFTHPEAIAKFMIYLIGFVLFVFGIVQLIAIVSARRVVTLGTGAFVLPAAVTLIGGFLLFNPFAESVMIIIAGSALILYGVSEFISSFRMKKVREYEQVDEQQAQVDDVDNQIDEQ